MKRPSTYICMYLTICMFVADLTAPRSTMKQSPLLKLAQARGTSVARTVRLPLMWKSRRAVRSLVTTWWNPDATPPVWEDWNFFLNVTALSSCFSIFIPFPFINLWVIFILRPIATVRSCYNTTSPQTNMYVCEKHKVLCTGRYWNSSWFYLTQIVNKKTNPRFAQTCSQFAN